MANFLIVVMGNTENFINHNELRQSNIISLTETSFILSTNDKCKEFINKMSQYRLLSNSEKFIYVEIFYDRSVPKSNDKVQITNFDTNKSELEQRIILPN